MLPSRYRVTVHTLFEPSQNFDFILAAYWSPDSQRLLTYASCTGDHPDTDIIGFDTSVDTGVVRMQHRGYGEVDRVKTLTASINLARPEAWPIATLLAQCCA